MSSRLLLDRNAGVLRHAAFGCFDPGARVWRPGPASGTPVALREAVRWLQRESGRPCRPPIGVIGAREATEAQLAHALALGRGLAEMGLALLCGGLVGVMTAASKGAAEAGGTVVGLLPDGDWRTANPWVTIPIATGIGVARNALIARAALALVAVGGGYGTISEMAFGLQFGKPVLAVGGAAPLAGVEPMATADEALERIARVVLELPAKEA
ncbi:MAG TPA: TIGR00725 family protein [Burkholderiales bacterium]|nr:TIGR00725 family protein [Burkholderiales bacterium]